MLGFYNYTVILTYLSVVSAGIGMFLASQGEIKSAIFCLMFSGLCDMLDGPVARTKKNRTESEKKFGIQIDSLCDCVSFGVQPAVLIYFIAINNLEKMTWLEIAGLVAGIMLLLGAVIRLAFFNVSEEERQQTEGKKLRSGYRGLPVTNVSWILPLVLLTGYFLKGDAYALVMVITELVISVLFILDFPFPKFHGKKLAAVGVCGLAVFIGICLM